ncbi:MAG: triose-phosphate isomerase [Acidimicrobiia bacterium]|nr:triose-phosphate isomerase [Acidimicrobiia bacterium]
MSRKDLIVGNWKMHSNHLEAIQMVQKLSYRLDQEDHDRVDVVVVPPFTSLRSVQTVLEVDRIPIGLGAQNCYWEEAGAFTGEVSPAMLAKLSVDWVIVGHSERRAMFGETDETVNRKIKAVLKHEMTPILCVGETAEQREEGQTEAVITTQIPAGLAGLSADDVTRVVVAYEPIWAIGTGNTAAPDDAGAVCTSIRAILADRWGDAADHVRVLYGGSVNAGNIAGFMAKRDIDGALVGGASLEPDAFASIVRYWI